MKGKQQCPLQDAWPCQAQTRGPRARKDQKGLGRPADLKLRGSLTTDRRSQSPSTTPAPACHWQNPTSTCEGGSRLSDSGALTNLRSLQGPHPGRRGTEGLWAREGGPAAPPGKTHVNSTKETTPWPGAPKGRTSGPPWVSGVPWRCVCPLQSLALIPHPSGGEGGRWRCWGPPLRLLEASDLFVLSSESTHTVTAHGTCPSTRLGSGFLAVPSHRR